MTPTVGRIIHVRGAGYAADPVAACQAAIVTGRDQGGRIAVTIFAPTGPHGEAARRTFLWIDSDTWHDPRECPEP